MTNKHLNQNDGNQETRTKIPYFFQFNSFRFFAAILVLVGHAESIREGSGAFNLHQIDFFKNGQHAVTFFFVLSGFLITYLLLKEKNSSQNVNVKSFYWKRIVRIWPLYFLLVFIGIAVQPFIIHYLNLTYKMPYSLEETGVLFITFLPGFVTYYFGNHLLEPLWSIGVEEWFYLIWGPFMKYVSKNLWMWILLLLLAKLLLNFLSSYQFFPPVVTYLIRMMRFEAMFIGGLMACTFFTSGKNQTQLSNFRLITFLISSIWLLIIVFNGTFFNGVLMRLGIIDKSLNAFICALFFALFVWSIAWKNKRNIILESKLFVFLGEISFGIYMYHLLVVTLVWSLLKQLQINPVFTTILYHFFGITLTIGIATLSKKYIENPVLKFKNRFS